MKPNQNLTRNETMIPFIIFSTNLFKNIDLFSCSEITRNMVML